MPEIVIPQHPKYDYTCEKCEHWQAHLKKQVVFFPNGQTVPVADMLAQGKLSSDMTTATIAPCTLTPQWFLTAPRNHWCSQFTGKVKY